MNAKGFTENLAKLRELAGFTQSQLASRVGVSAASVSRWESGTVSPKRKDVENLERALASGGDLLRAWEREAAGATLPAWMRDTMRLEQEASSIEYVSPLLVPGLLQCESYAQLVFAAAQPLTSREEIARLARIRSQRYEALRQYSDPRVSAVIPYIALTSVPEDVRRSQASHLITVSDLGVNVYLVPEGHLLLGATSPMVLFRLRNGGTVASSDHMSGNVIHDHAAWDRMSEVARGALAAALPSDQSRKLLEGLTDE